MLWYWYRVPGAKESGVRTVAATNSDKGACRARMALLSGS